MPLQSRPGRPIVLLVDDDPDVLAGLRLSLRQLPITVITAGSAREALELLDQGGVWMVISDERMPEMAGSELLAVVRQRWPEVTRVILSGQASMDAVIASINDARIFRFLTKPCSAEELRATVLEGLAMRDRQVDEQQRQVDDVELDDQLDDALSQLRIVLQPILDARTGETAAFEVLLRCDHAVLTGPPGVLDAASRLDRHFDVDRAIRRQAASVLPHLPKSTRLFVNLMPESLADPLLTSDTEPLLPWANRVVLEVTERVGLDSIENLEDRLDVLRERGFSIALDDLGAGYAGLNSFATLRPNIVKFDMELVRGIDRSPTQVKVVSSMVRLCNEMGITTVAEGIETEAERVTVVSLGCDLLQGFLLGRPGPPDRALAMAEGPMTG